MSDDTLTKEAQARLNDLKVQAIMFDLEVDIEALTLVAKSTHKDAVWITRYKDKRAESDFDEYFDIDRE